ncbi:hypothetical protein [Bacillus sp. FJAT-44742]|uniref:hypothetical protein n=1 Tax=Bacillus sp. FJAT-44742 TaxID=2014005 RepID=UPI001E2C2B61|nr:hypothetical protein [Bacillus sp. FJAT-44742]
MIDREECARIIATHLLPLNQRGDQLRMLLTNEDKKHLLKILAQNQRRVMASKEDRAKSKAVYDKIYQSMRNEDINKDHQRGRML